ncbi:ArsR/SmtB family transcription factor [Kribbella italica]|uniref:DNA-binding transcriptional ArsR family regulator n=1 Tax=Kribbella italica TaxID=1540520 RepID=A0A7W9J5Q8_9ACTN|nr:helix-turn-helix domain-containing protein [Kribbella italica]MBB5835615.1 DNA-binding transcriptional ArsR family regulator [Kribbella italica]
MSGVLTLRFPAGTALEPRFVLSPLWEALASIRVLQDEAGRAAYPEWTEWATRRLRRHRRRLGMLFSLVQPSLPYVPSFLFASPRTPVPDLAADLVSVRSSTSQQVRRDLDLFSWVLSTRGAAGVPAGPAPGRGPLPEPLEALYDDPASGLSELSDQVELYWKSVIAPRWGRIRAVLAEDLTDRGREGSLDELGPAVSWDGRTLLVEHTGQSTSRVMDGSELLLMPSVFAWSGPWPVALPPDQPRITYPAGGTESLWSATEAPIESLVAVLGISRAKLLGELNVPASTSDLAIRTDMTAGGASQHLTALRSAGLVSSHRVGHSVLYARTATAEALLRNAAAGSS